MTQFSPEDEALINNRAAHYNTDLNVVTLLNAIRLRRAYKFKTLLIPTLETYLRLRFKDEALLLMYETHVSATVLTMGQPGVVTFQLDRTCDNTFHVYSTHPSGMIADCGKIQLQDLSVAEILDHLEAAIKFIESKPAAQTSMGYPNV